MATLWVYGAFLLCVQQAFAASVTHLAGFIKSPMSQIKLVGDTAVMHCEVVGSPIPEVQWWFLEGDEPNETTSQLFDGARLGYVHINATYIKHGATSLHLIDLTLNSTGVYECRASNDPDRNALKTRPKIKWIHSQANVIVFENPSIVAHPSEVHNMTTATLSCNLTNAHTSFKSHYWMKNGKMIDNTKKDDGTLYTEYNVSKIDLNSGIYSCVFLSNEGKEFKEEIAVKSAPHVTTHKHSENGNENDKTVLLCESHSHPLPTDWSWHKISESTNITNGTDRYTIMNTPNNSTLIINDLQNDDAGDYQCSGENDLGKHSVTIHLRVRSRLAALWPFLGIVAEVIILVTVIFIYEKRRKPDEINDDDDSGAAPLNSNSATNHKDKNVRQRNSN